ncbi:VIT1/CCC1 transporter family protein [Thermophagus sp. OGC60D27]|uniref:VIT1/CCC1 transporter family protein n=1 Tax=Thermophagus sp. OGC60D27 TaxID=3458415 RepID=UPI0040379031
MLEVGNLTFVGLVVLGLNDAIVELTGALARFTLALGETKIISIAGLVTGISGALSMAASEFLSTKAEGDPRAKEAAL